MDKPAFDPARFKEQERAGFNLVAQRYEAAMHMLQPAVVRLLALAELEPGMAVLDVATGPGTVARQAARLVSPGGKVLGVDIAEAALEQARRQAAAETLTQVVSFEVADAENLPFEAASFDRVLCSMGLMHFPNTAQALAEFKRVLKPGGKLVAAVWGEEAEAAFVAVAAQNLSRNFPPPKVERPSMFRFGKAEVLEKLVADAGFSQAKAEAVRLEATYPDAASYWGKFLDVAGITTVSLMKQSTEVREHLEKDVAKDLAPYQTSSGYHLTSTIMLISAFNS